MLQAHLAAKTALLGGLAWQHQAQVATLDDQCGSAVACLQVRVSCMACSDSHTASQCLNSTIALQTVLLHMGTAAEMP